MTREEYIDSRNRGTGLPVYEYYKEKIKETKHDLKSAQEFFQFFQSWPFGNEVAQEALKYYDDKFEVVKIEDLKSGNVIKYI